MISYGDNGQEVFLGHSVTQNKNVSEATAREIDNEIKAVIDHAYAEAKRILTERRADLESLAHGLLEYETLSGDEIQAVIRGEKIVRKVVDEPMADQRRASVPTASPRPDVPGGLGPLPAPG
jgi:cell division protease FtsH